MTLGDDGKVVSISSLDNTDGMMSKVYYDACNKENALAYKLCTWEVNPNPEVTEEALRKEFALNINAFYKYFANMPEVSSGQLFPGVVRLNKDMRNVFDYDIDEVIPTAQYNHVMAVDPAFRNDSFGIATGYRHGNHIYIDGVKKVSKGKGSTESYIRPSDIENFVFEWIPRLNVDTFIYDVDLVLGIVEKLDDIGFTTVKHHADGEAYSRWLNLNDYVGEIDLDIVYNENLHHEAKQLSKEQLPSGKVRIDHPYSGSKDLADVVSNSIWYLCDYESDLVFKPVGGLGKMGFIHPDSRLENPFYSDGLFNSGNVSNYKSY